MHTGYVTLNKSTSALKLSSILQVSNIRGDKKIGGSMYVLRSWLKN